MLKPKSAQLRGKKDPSKGGRPTQSEIAQRTVRILEVSTRLFIQHGFAATTLDEIAKSSGVAKKTLYANYGDKADIFAAVVRDRIAQSGIRNLVLKLDKASAEKTLKAAAARLVELFVAEAGVDVRRLIIAESRRFPHLMQSFLSESLVHLYEIVSQLLGELNSIGLLRITNTHKAAKVFVDLTVGITYLHVTAGLRTTIPSSPELDDKVAMFIRYYS